MLRLFGAGIGLLLLSTCASPPTPPDQALQAAESAISHAEQARVADYASPELGIARGKLTAANAAVQREEMLLAERLADQSRVEAKALPKSAASSVICKAEPQLNSRAPVALKEAEDAVLAAEQPRRGQGQALGQHLLVMADRKVEVARALALARLYEDQRKVLSEQREGARLDSPTREADQAQQQNAELQRRLARVGHSAAVACSPHLAPHSIRRRQLPDLGGRGW